MGSACSEWESSLITDGTPMSAHRKQREQEEEEKERKREEKLRKREQKKKRETQKKVKKQQVEEQKKLHLKIAMEERKLLLAQRNLESIRLIAELLSRAKVRAVHCGRQQSLGLESPPFCLS